MTLAVYQPDEATRAEFALMEAESNALLRYWRLRVDTVDFSKMAYEVGRLPHPISWLRIEDAPHAKRALSTLAESPESYALLQRLSAWEVEYNTIQELSPKWRLKDMIEDVSETHAFTSWPHRWERDIWEWAMQEGPEPLCPFEDRRSAIDPGFRIRMQALIKECGGFLYMCEESNNVIFVQSSGLPRIWRHQDHLAAIDRDKPFGFLNDMGRPNWHEYLKPLTAEEEQVFNKQQIDDGWRAKLKRLTHLLRTYK